MLNGSFVSVSTAASALGLNVHNQAFPTWNALVVGGALTAFAAVFSAFLTRKVLQQDQPPILRGTPFFGHWRFFTERYDFVNEGIRKLGSMFQFYILNYKIIAVSGDEARKAFLTIPSLSFREGYRVLHGSAPTIEDINIKAENASNIENGWFSKRVLAILRKDRLEKVLPQMFSDIDSFAKGWGESGKFDPLTDIYKIVFQLTTRAGACSEIADDPAKLDNLVHEFTNIEKTVDATSMLLTWLPGKKRQTKKDSTKALYLTFKNILDDRRSTGRRESDAMQVLIDEGCSDSDIIQFIMTTLFAGVVNTGIMSAWMLMYLGTNPEWKEKVKDEIRSFVSKYTSEDDAPDHEESIAALLSRIPPSAWEDEMPTTDLCLRETIRLVQSSVFLRRNTGDDLYIGNVKVAHGDFVVYPTADVHHNEDIYPDHLKFDPSRYERKEDRKKALAYVGWGAGRHPCLGMRFAKLEVKCIAAMFLTSYDYDVVDESDNVLHDLPVPDRNNLFVRTKRPDGKPLYLRYSRVKA